MEGEQSEVSETVRGGIVDSLPLSIGGELPRPPVALASKDCGASLHLSIPAHLRALSPGPRAMTGNDTTFT